MPGEAVAAAASDPILGFHGKVPTNGDFIRRRLPGSFLEPWDEWLQQAMARSKAQLGEAWLESYLTSPIWRFALPRELCGPLACAGVLMPSVDSVGRYYPITIASLLPAAPHPFAMAAQCGPWFAAAEDAALTCLDEGFSLEAFEERLTGLGSPALPGDARASTGNPGIELATGGCAWPLDGGSVDRLCPAVYSEILDGLLGSRFDRYSLWWTTGSDQVAPAFRLYQALPALGEFASFLSGAAPADF